MPPVEWKPEFSVGFERLDGEHRHLFSLLNQLNTALANQRQKSMLGAILRELDWYTRWHFKAEEVLMKRYAYPDTLAHIVEHDRFREQVAQYSAHFQSGRDVIAVEVSDALQEWLMRHILQSDAEYASFFQANGITDIKLQQQASV
jgi:hemerythrin-like metal-binding protein